MKKNSTPLGDVISSIKSNSTLVIGLAVILIIAAFVYIPTVKEELGAKPGEAGGLLTPGFGPGDIFGPTGPQGPGDLILFEEIQLTNMPGNSIPGDIFDNKIVFLNTYADNGVWSDLYAYDINSNQTFQITNDPDTEGGLPRMWGNVVVFEKNHQIFSWNFDTQMWSILTYDGINQNPDIYGSKVVFSRKNTNYDPAPMNIYMVDLNSPPWEIIQISDSLANQLNPRIYENRIVWDDYRNFYSPFGNSDIYMYDINTETETQIITNPNTQIGAYIWEQKIVWMDSRNSIGGNNWDIYMYDLENPVPNGIQITSNYTHEEFPGIWDDCIVYDDRAEYLNYDIYLHYLKDSQKYIVSNADKNQEMPIIWGLGSKFTIIWADYRNNHDPMEQVHSDIYMRQGYIE